MGKPGRLTLKTESQEFGDNGPLVKKCCEFFTETQLISKHHKIDDNEPVGHDRYNFCWVVIPDWNHWPRALTANNREYGLTKGVGVDNFWVFS